jgi:hypothetical protein
MKERTRARSVVRARELHRHGSPSPRYDLARIRETWNRAPAVRASAWTAAGGHCGARAAGSARASVRHENGAGGRVLCESANCVATGNSSPRYDLGVRLRGVEQSADAARRCERVNPTAGRHHSSRARYELGASARHETRVRGPFLERANDRATGRSACARVEIWARVREAWNRVPVARAERVSRTAGAVTPARKLRTRRASAGREIARK